MKHLKKLLALGFVALGAACGDDDDGGGPSNVDTGLPESQPLGEVTPAELMNACNSVQSAVDERFNDDRITRFVCEFVSALGTENQASCQDAAADCLANPPEGASEMLGFEGSDIGCGELMGTEGCQATVGEFEGCFNDALDAIDAFMAQFSCANAGNINLESMESGPLDQPPSSCAQLEMECPGAGFGGGEIQ
jgi:hypothetical protein